MRWHALVQHLREKLQAPRAIKRSLEVDREEQGVVARLERVGDALGKGHELLFGGAAAAVARLGWVDQAPVRAALEGWVLILDGIEKAEYCTTLSQRYMVAPESSTVC